MKRKGRTTFGFGIVRPEQAFGPEVSTAPISGGGEFQARAWPLQWFSRSPGARVPVPTPSPAADAAAKRHNDRILPPSRYVIVAETRDRVGIRRFEQRRDRAEVNPVAQARAANKSERGRSRTSRNGRDPRARRQRAVRNLTGALERRRRAQSAGSPQGSQRKRSRPYRTRGTKRLRVGTRIETHQRDWPRRPPTPSSRRNSVAARPPSRSATAREYALQSAIYGHRPGRKNGIVEDRSITSRAHGTIARGQASASNERPRQSPLPRRAVRYSASRSGSARSSRAA